MHASALIGWALALRLQAAVPLVSMCLFTSAFLRYRFLLSLGIGADGARARLALELLEHNKLTRWEIR